MTWAYPSYPIPTSYPVEFGLPRLASPANNSTAWEPEMVTKNRQKISKAMDLSHSAPIRLWDAQTSDSEIQIENSFCARQSLPHVPEYI